MPIQIEDVRYCGVYLMINIKNTCYNDQMSARTPSVNSSILHTLPRDLAPRCTITRPRIDLKDRMSYQRKPWVSVSHKSVRFSPRQAPDTKSLAGCTVSLRLRSRRHKYIQTSVRHIVR